MLERDPDGSRLGLKFAVLQRDVAVPYAIDFTNQANIVVPTEH